MRMRGLISLVAAAVITPACGSSGPAIANMQQPAPSLPAISAPGRIEGATDTTRLGFGRDGVLRELLVNTGDQVRKGQLLARLDCRDLEASRAVADARVAQATAVRAEVMRGGRDDRRAEAAAALRAAEATVIQADAARARVRSLQAEGFSSLAELEVSDRDWRVAVGLRDAARERVSVEAAAPTTEALLRIDADIGVHRAVSHEIAAQLGLCSTWAPTDGVVLQTRLRPGERWSAFQGVPVLELVDLSVVRVRAEVDERDAIRVVVGQRVSIQSDAWPGETLSGRVTSLTPQMGRRAVLTGNPAERHDQDVREAMVALDVADRRALPGLRVTVIIRP